MRTISSTLQNYLDSGKGISAYVFVWVEAKNRLTLATETLGLWSGSDVVEISINGSPRTYYGAGTLISIDNVVYEVGLGIRTLNVSLNGVSPEVDLLIRGYDVKFAPIEIHRGLVDPDTGNLIEEPHRLFKGFVNSSPIFTPEENTDGSVTLDLVSTARNLTKTLAIKKSAESQKLRSGDEFRKYADISGQIDVFWGQKRFSSRPAGTPITNPLFPFRRG